MVGEKYIGAGAPCFFIAEIGNNHNGDYYLAKRTIEEAQKAGADAVKFQKRHIQETFAKELRDMPQTKDQIFGKTYGEYREHLELTEDEFIKLKAYAEELGLIFFATPFDHKSVDFLERVGVELYKIASFDNTNIPLLEYIAQKGKPIILSVGMADQDEADEAIETILKYNDQLVVLYCVSIYPTPDEKLNLATLSMLKERYSPIPIGYSGHEKDFVPTLTSVTLGAKCVERHFTIDKSLPGPDHATVSINPEEFKKMVLDTRRIETILGKPGKVLWEEEIKTRQKHGKSVVAKVDIKKGTVLTKDMLVCKSPGYGIKPKDLNSIVGKKTTKDLSADSILLLEYIVACD